jgi:hypothetical protein
MFINVSEEINASIFRFEQKAEQAASLPAASLMYASIRLHGVRSKMIIFFVVIAVRT